MMKKTKVVCTMGPNTNDRDFWTQKVRRSVPENSRTVKK